LYFYQIYGVQQYMIKTSLGLSLMIQFKAKTPNNILLIPTLAFTPYITSPNVLATSLNLNKNPNVLVTILNLNKNPNVLAFFILSSY